MISVVIPCFNRETTIGQALDSLLAQTHDDWEAIVVDDGSSDRTAEILEGYAREDPRISVLRQANRGVSAARNRGIEAATRQWLFFLDADDWISPGAFEALLGAVASKPAEVVYGGYTRVSATGREAREPRPEHEENLFPVFAKMCAFSVHSCLAQTELIRSVGGFDETLVTCEDWDLWQRIARAGARFAAIPDYVAYYRMRADSASVNGARMLADGLEVISRGHGIDPRLTNADPRFHNGLPASARCLAQLYFVCYAASLTMACGEDARWMLDAIDGPPRAHVAPSGVAETLFYAVPIGIAAVPEQWPSFPPQVLERCREFIAAVESWSQNRWLGFQARRTLESLIADVDERPLPRDVAGSHHMALDCTAAPPESLQLDPGIESVFCTVKLDGREIGKVELPTCDGWVPPRFLADRIADALAWEALGAWLERRVYPQLQVEGPGGITRVLREGAVLAEGEAPDPPAADGWLHNEIGWTVMLQELWDRPDWDGSQFYSQQPEPTDRVMDVAAEELAAVELSSPLPTLACEGQEAVVGLTLAGIPVGTLRLTAEEGTVRSYELRRAALEGLGYELCRATIRELILAPAAAPTDALGHVLQAAALRRRSGRRRASLSWLPESEGRDLVPGWEDGLDELLPDRDTAVVIGRRAIGGEGTSGSRYAVLPAPAAEAMIAAALPGGDPVLQAEGEGPRGCVAYAPCLQWDRSGIPQQMAEADSLPRHLEFEATFALDPDPWDYGSEYEQRKYEHALGLLPERVGDALELGCAGGFFTELLAPRAERVLACDISLVALSAAARRCRGLENVAFSRLDLFADQIPQGYDLVVCSETLYYAADRDQLDETLGRIAGALSPGGHLLTANAHVLADDEAGAGFDWDVPFGARGIGGAIGELGCLDLVEEVETEAYRVQLYRKRSGPRFIRRLRRPRRRSILHGEMTLQAGERFRRDGGTVRREERERNGLQQTSLPILMYHQIAETGAEKTRQWRTTPADFAAQLEFLRGAGYYSLSFDDWRTATKARQAPPGKPIILTFDDGYVDFRETAAPLLREYGFTANLFVVSDLVGTASTWDEDLGEPAPLMGWDEIQQVAGQGFGIGSHSARHRALVTLELGELASDLARSRHLLEARLGRAVTAISYPYGLYDQKVATAAAASGFQFGVTTDGARAPWSAPLLALPRLEVQGGASLEDFALLLEP